MMKDSAREPDGAEETDASNDGPKTGRPVVGHAPRNLTDADHPESIRPIRGRATPLSDNNQMAPTGCNHFETLHPHGRVRPIK
jgi:hypothetical protein